MHTPLMHNIRAHNIRMLPPVCALNRWTRVAIVNCILSAYILRGTVFSSNAPRYFVSANLL